LQQTLHEYLDPLQRAVEAIALEQRRQAETMATHQAVLVDAINGIRLQQQQAALEQQRRLEEIHDYLVEAIRSTLQRLVVGEAEEEDPTPPPRLDGVAVAVKPALDDVAAAAEPALDDVVTSDGRLFEWEVRTTRRRVAGRIREETFWYTPCRRLRIRSMRELDSFLAVWDTLWPTHEISLEQAAALEDEAMEQVVATRRAARG
jgi:hypothetical protein